MKAKAEIESTVEVVEHIIEYEGTKFSEFSYEEGIRDALKWTMDKNNDFLYGNE